MKELEIVVLGDELAILRRQVAWPALRPADQVFLVGATIYDGCEARNVRPVIPLRQTPDVKVGKDKPPTCEHGEWTFAGSDAKRGASKWRCPTGECKPASVWIKASRLHPDPARA